MFESTRQPKGQTCAPSVSKYIRIRGSTELSWGGFPWVTGIAAEGGGEGIRWQDPFTSGLRYHHSCSHFTLTMKCWKKSSHWQGCYPVCSSGSAACVIMEGSDKDPLPSFSKLFFHMLKSGALLANHRSIIDRRNIAAHSVPEYSSLSSSSITSQEHS